jgi:phage regulator Rha-like protein
MSNLSVQDRNGVLVADSRLIALELGIQHKNFLATIEKYNPVMASNPEMQPVAFEARVVKRPQGGTYEERFAWLTESQATFIMTLSRNTEQVINCKLALSIAFDKAKKVIQETIPAQTQEIEKLKLELELAKTQERLLTTTSALATIHGSGMVALILGKPDAVITKTERVETVVTVDNKGKAIASFDGVGITYLAKRYGFGSNTKACRYWLSSIGISQEQWLTEPTLIKSQKLPRDLLPELDAQYAARTGVRQRLIGE